MKKISTKQRVRQYILDIVEKETNWIVSVQSKRTWYFDIFNKTMSFLGSHLTYMLGIPILFWFGFAQFSRNACWLMCLGIVFCNMLKDLLHLPRPRSPVVPFSKKYSLEYGFPSSHSVNALSFPIFAAYYYLMSTEEIGSLEYLLVIGIAIFFCFSVCFSRIYCGMHSGIDVIGGMAVGLVIVSFWINNFEMIDRWMSSNPFSALHSMLFFLTLFSIYPSPPVPTPSYEDSTCFAFATVGITLGSYHFSTTPHSLTHPHTSAVYYSYDHFGLVGTITRVLIGVVMVILWKVAIKAISEMSIRSRHKKDLERDKKEQENKKNQINKFGEAFLVRGIVYTGIGFLAASAVPTLFESIGIGKNYTNFF